MPKAKKITKKQTATKTTTSKPAAKKNTTTKSAIKAISTKSKKATQTKAKTETKVKKVTKSKTLRVPTKSEIAKKAYFLYLERGMHSGNHHNDWAEAEKLLVNEFNKSKSKK